MKDIWQRRDASEALHPVGFLIAIERIELMHAPLLPEPNAPDASG